MIKVGNYTIHNDLPNLDTESDKSNRRGYIEIWESADYKTIFSIKGDLPDYVNKKLFELAISRGHLHWYNRRITTWKKLRQMLKNSR
jgi:hypothetical protein